MASIWFRLGTSAVMASSHGRALSLYAFLTLARSVTAMMFSSVAGNGVPSTLAARWSAISVGVGPTLPTVTFTTTRAAVDGATPKRR